MKMRTLSFRLEAKPEYDVLEVYSDIGEYDDGEMADFGANKLTKLLKDSKSKKLVVRINSMGGELYSGLAVYNILKDSGKEITVKVDGMAASAASIIAMAGDKVVMPRTSQMMIHNCWTIAYGSAAKFRKLADDMDKSMIAAKNAYLAKAGEKLTPEVLDKLLDAESYLTAEECLKLGLCDEVPGFEAAVSEPEEPGEEKEEKKEEPAKKAEAAPLTMEKVIPTSLWEVWDL